MRPLLPLLLCIMFPWPAVAQDPLKSDACRQALAALEAARSDGHPAAIESTRRNATQACLGGSGEARRPAPVAQAPLVVPPPVIEPPPDLPRPAGPSAPPPELLRPPTITSCDAGGCWDSRGTRLNRAGPVLLGPNGACVTSGATVQCP